MAADRARPGRAHPAAGSHGPDDGRCSADRGHAGRRRADRRRQPACSPGRCWAWGALGLALTAASALPGLAGGAAGWPSGASCPPARAAAPPWLLGLGLGRRRPRSPASRCPALGPRGRGGRLRGHGRPRLAGARRRADPVPDWPARRRPAGRAGPPTDGDRVVVRGDCLWHIAADSLLGELGRLPSDREVAAAVARLVARQRRRHRSRSRRAASPARCCDRPDRRAAPHPSHAPTPPRPGRSR